MVRFMEKDLDFLMPYGNLGTRGICLMSPFVCLKRITNRLNIGNYKIKENGEIKQSCI